jgi:peptide/nickel transport system permease protein
MILRRLGLAIPLLFVVSAFTFVLVSLVPGSAATTIAGPYATQQQVSALSRQLGLNQPIYLQYWHWLERALHGNFGHSLLNGEAVTTILNGRLAITLTLIIATTIVLTLAGVGLGVVSALSGPRIGRVIDVGATLALAIPSFWLGLLLIFLFAVKLRLLPATGWVPFSQSPSQWLESLALPVATLALGNLALVAKQTRDSMTDTMSRDFVRVCEANGIRRWRIIVHALRNASVPIMTVLGVVFVALLGATVFVETVFALPGLGSLAASSTLNHDLPVIQGVAIYFTIIVIIVNLLIDIAYALIDPRIRST